MIIEEYIYMKSKTINGVLAASLFAWSMSACTDVWEEHYQAEKPIAGDSIVVTDNDLWKQIESDSTLTEFAQLLKVTGYDSLLMTDRVYTVWAPKNGSGFIDDMSKLQEPSKEDIALWKKEIVENHIANVSVQANGMREKSKENNIEMLNEKAYYLLGSPTAGYTIQEKPFLSSNVITKNGVLHKVDGYLEFRATIWEQLAKEPELSSLWEFLSKDYKKEFAPGLSVEGPIVDGEQTWLDSAFTTSCRWFYEIGYLDEVDSSYTMYALTNDAWSEMEKLMRPYYQYPEGSFEEEQSTEEAIDSLVHEMMCRHLVFSNTVNKGFFDGVDTILKSNWYSWNRLTFKGEEAKALSNGMIAEKELYNGKLVIVNSVNYNPFTCWHDTLRVEGESLSNADEAHKQYISANKENPVTIHRDSLLYYSVSNHTVGVYSVSGKTNPTFNFKINNVLSGWYDVKIVLLPPQLLSYADTTFVKPNKFWAYLSHNGQNIDTDSLYTGINKNRYYYSDSSKVDTVHLGCVKIPACEYDLKNLCGKDPTLQLSIESKIDFGNALFPKEGSKADKSDWKYDNSFRIDQVIFEPIKAPEGASVEE